MGVSFLRGPVGELEEGFRLQGTERNSGRRARELELLSLRELCYGNLEAYKKARKWAPLSMRASLGNLGEGSYSGAYVWKKVLGRVSFHLGVPFENLGKWVRLPETLKIS